MIIYICPICRAHIQILFKHDEDGPAKVICLKCNCMMMALRPKEYKEWKQK